MAQVAQTHRSSQLEPEAPPAPGADLHERVRGKNINETTLLATDYLNHFNEIIMLLELLPDMPEMIEEVQAWQPKSYEAHFQESCFAAKDLAIEAYRGAPGRYRKPFDRTVHHMDEQIADALNGLEEATTQQDGQRVAATVERVTDRLRRFIDIASGIIHGDERTMDQDEIDGILG